MKTPTDFPFHYGNMWSAYNDADLFLITTNGTTRNERLVMGAGIAREAKNRFALWDLDKALGQDISRREVKMERDGYKIHDPYYLLVSPKWPQAKLGLFQTKDYFRDKADLFLISTAVEMLAEWVKEQEKEAGRQLSVHLNCPGIGYGGQALERVMPYLLKLPESVAVWRRDYERPQPVAMPPENHSIWLVAKHRDKLYEFLSEEAGVWESDAKTAMAELFVLPLSSTDQGIMMQYLTALAYLELRKNDELDEEQRKGNAFQQARNEWARIVNCD